MEQMSRDEYTLSTAGGNKTPLVLGWFSRARTKVNITRDWG